MIIQNESISIIGAASADRFVVLVDGVLVVLFLSFFGCGLRILLSQEGRLVNFHVPASDDPVYSIVCASTCSNIASLLSFS